MNEEKNLYRRIKAGDPEALRVLLNRYHRLLFDFLFRLTNDPALADDLCQQVFIRVLSHRGEAPTRLRSWLLVIARNLTYDYFRSAQFKREHLMESTETESLEESPESLYMLVDQRESVAKLLQQISPEQREVVILRFYHDLTLQEIAELVSAPLGTVKSRLFYALKNLKSKYHVVEMGHSDE